MTAPAIDFWFEFASTYSYPACLRIDALAAQAGVSVRYRPFLLGPIFKAQGWETSPFNIYESKGRYMWRDLERICEAQGLPFRRPAVFPQNSLLASRVAVGGCEESWFVPFCHAVFKAEFGEGRRIDDPAVIADLLREIGAPVETAFAMAQSDTVKIHLRTQTEEAGRAGIFGAPSCVTAGGELFWGNDRLDEALAWAQREGGT